jgi:hypothetical protein
MDGEMGEGERSPTRKYNAPSPEHKEELPLHMEALE